MKLLPLVLLSLLLLLFVSGCAHVPGGIAASTHPIEGSYRVLGPTHASSHAVYLLGFIPLNGSSSLKEARDEAIRKKAADALIAVTAESYTQYWILFRKETIVVDGIAIRFK